MSSRLSGSRKRACFWRRSSSRLLRQPGFALTMMNRVAHGAYAGARLIGPRQQPQCVQWRAPWAVFRADAMPAAFLLQMLAQQHAGARIEQAHVHQVPLHIDLATDPAGRRAIVGRFHFDTAIDMNRPLSILVIPERLQRQRLQEGLLFAEHGRHLPLGAAMDPRVGPVLFPVVQIHLRFFHALEALALQRRLLCVGDAGFDFSFSIWITHPAGQRSYTVMRQNIAIERVQLGIVDVGCQDTFTKIIENDDSCGSAQSPEGLLVQFGPDAGTGSEGEKTDRLAAVTQRQHEQPRTPVFACYRIAHHRAGAVIDLALFSGWRFDDRSCFWRRGCAKFPRVAQHALVATVESVTVDQVLPDSHRVAAEFKLLCYQFTVRLAETRRSTTRFPGRKVGDHLYGRF